MFDYYDSALELWGDVGVLAVSGETDLFTAPQLRRDLDEAIEATDGDVVLDLTDLELVDSTALGIMMAAAAHMVAERRSLILVVTRGHVRRVFGAVGLLDFFSIVPTRSEAMARVSMGQYSRKVA
jgi:anti-sigma B factor antagonist